MKAVKRQQLLHCGNVATVAIAVIVVATVAVVDAVEVKVAWHQWLAVLKQLHEQ